MSDKRIRERTKRRWQQLDQTDRSIQYFVARKLLILDRQQPVDAQIERIQYNSARIDSKQELSHPDGEDILVTYLGKKYKRPGLAGMFDKESYIEGPYTRYFSLDEFIHEIDAYYRPTDEARVSRAAYDLRNAK